MLSIDRSRRMDTILASSCRLCLKEPPSDSLVFSVFDTYQGSVLVDLIDELFSVKIAKSDRLLSVCLDCVNRINTVRMIQHLFVENNRKLHDWLQNESTSTTIEKNVVYEMYEVTMPANPPTQPEFEQVLFTQNVPLEETTIPKLQDEPIEEPVADKSDTNTEKVVMLDIEEVCEDEYDTVRSSESDAENGAAKREQDEKIESTTTEDARLLKNKCYLCGRIFLHAIEFMQHLPEHFLQMPYTCVECDGLVFKTVQLASRHIGMHDVHDRPFQCRLCPLRFVTRCNSLTHERKMHRFKLKQKAAAGQNSKSTQAPRQQAARIPAKRGASGRPGAHQCEICSKTFTAKKNLTRHLMVHTGETPFKCTQCNRSFRQAGELKSHHLVHESVESYRCDQCDTTYRNFSMLSKHRKMFHSPTNTRHRRPISSEASSESKNRVKQVGFST